MLPIVLDPNSVAVGLAGAGDGFARRRVLLDRAGVAATIVAPDAADETLQILRALFVAGLPPDAARALATRGRRLGILVNVEDVPDLCDFHVPAMVRQGDLLVSVSTGGKAPGLARLIREWLARTLDEAWSGRVAEIADLRQEWRSAGHAPAEVARRIRARVAEREWLS